MLSVSLTKKTSASVLKFLLLLLFFFILAKIIMKNSNIFLDFPVCVMCCYETNESKCRKINCNLLKDIHSFLLKPKLIQEVLHCDNNFITCSILACHKLIFFSAKQRLYVGCRYKWCCCCCFFLSSFPCSFLGFLNIFVFCARAVILTTFHAKRTLNGH